MLTEKKWYRFDGGPITHWGRATEAQAKAYRDIRAHRYPDATFTEVDGEPDDGTIVNVDVMLDAAGIQVPWAPFKPIKEEYLYKPASIKHVGVAVATPTFIYVVLKDRAEFDKIASPMHDNGMQDTGHVLVKQVGEIGNGKPVVYFQYWLVERDYVAERSAEMPRKESAFA
jgi:hypothetical protein